MVAVGAIKTPGQRIIPNEKNNPPMAKNGEEKPKPVPRRAAAIVGALAKRKVVENLVQNVVHRANLRGELSDLVTIKGTDSFIVDEALNLWVSGNTDYAYYTWTWAL